MQVNCDNHILSKPKVMPAKGSLHQSSTVGESMPTKRKFELSKWWLVLCGTYVQGQELLVGPKVAETMYAASAGQGVMTQRAWGGVMFSLLELPSDLTESFCGLGVLDLVEGTSGLIGKA